ncbi:MAG: arsenosugar biosynthesis radical SAM protein ArsS [Nitrospirota bacterium]|nr:arsenosugar biosynthesis radical SAM protein ArsS [Nitrospirota bacterium]
METVSFTQFSRRISQQGVMLRRTRLDTLQVNLGKLCNQTCTHCHVNAGPGRSEQMSLETIDHVLDFLGDSTAATLDITGGAPELNPNFRYLVEEAVKLGKRVIVRSNLTVIFEQGQGYLPGFFRENKVEVIASLPCYTAETVDAQRGDGVFERSIQALKKLNEQGYGDDPELVLNLVYNPPGMSLPGDQSKLEEDYKKALQADHGIVFNHLFTLTNMPIARFAEYLAREGETDAYMCRLAEAFNPDTLELVMCTGLASVDWEGYVYDCDFNQMLRMRIGGARPLTIKDATDADLIDRRVQVMDHCYGCTAGPGSSCTGALR